jgi:hypothetical protein
MVLLGTASGTTQGLTGLVRHEENEGRGTAAWPPGDFFMAADARLSQHEAALLGALTVRLPTDYRSA